MKCHAAFPWLIGLLLAGGVAGCIQPTLSPLEERRTRSMREWQALKVAQWPAEQVLTPGGAVYFALTNNIEHRLSQLEIQIRREAVSGNRFRYLPKLNIQAEVSDRDEPHASTSRSIITEQESLEASYSAESTVKKADLTLMYNLLDFGITYFRVRQAKERVAIAAFNRRREAQNLALEVTKAYWRAYVANHALEGAREILDRARAWQAKAERALAESTVSDLEGLETQKNLVLMEMRLEAFEQEWRLAHAELAALMGVDPRTRFSYPRLRLPDRLPALAIDVEAFEKEALMQRSELFIQDRERAISRSEVRVRVLELLPSPSAYLGNHHDANKLLYRDHWYMAGLKSAWNLLYVPAGVSAVKQAKRNIELDDHRRLTMAAAVLTQVHLSILEYQAARRDFALTRKLYHVQARLKESVGKYVAAGQVDEQTRLRLEAEELFGRVRYLGAYSQVLHARQRIYNALGRSYQPENLSASPIPPAVDGGASSRRDLDYLKPWLNEVDAQGQAEHLEADQSVVPSPFGERPDPVQRGAEGTVVREPGAAIPDPLSPDGGRRDHHGPGAAGGRPSELPPLMPPSVVVPQRDSAAGASRRERPSWDAAPPMDPAPGPAPTAPREMAAPSEETRVWPATPSRESPSAPPSAGPAPSDPRDAESVHGAREEGAATSHDETPYDRAAYEKAAARLEERLRALDEATREENARREGFGWAEEEPAPPAARPKAGDATGSRPAEPHPAEPLPAEPKSVAPEPVQPESAKPLSPGLETEAAAPPRPHRGLSPASSSWVPDAPPAPNPSTLEGASASRGRAGRASGSASASVTNPGAIQAAPTATTPVAAHEVSRDAPSSPTARRSPPGKSRGELILDSPAVPSAGPELDTPSDARTAGDGEALDPVGEGQAWRDLLGRLHADSHGAPLPTPELPKATLPSSISYEVLPAPHVAPPVAPRGSGLLSYGGAWLQAGSRSLRQGWARVLEELIPLPAPTPVTPPMRGPGFLTLGGRVLEHGACAVRLGWTRAVEEMSALPTPAPIAPSARCPGLLTLGGRLATACRGATGNGLRAVWAAMAEMAKMAKMEGGEEMAHPLQSDSSPSFGTAGHTDGNTAKPLDEMTPEDLRTGKGPRPTAGASPVRAVPVDPAALEGLARLETMERKAAAKSRNLAALREATDRLEADMRATRIALEHLEHKRLLEELTEGLEKVKPALAKTPPVVVESDGDTEPVAARRATPSVEGASTPAPKTPAIDRAPALAENATNSHSASPRAAGTRTPRPVNPSRAVLNDGVGVEATFESILDDLPLTQPRHAPTPPTAPDATLDAANDNGAAIRPSTPRPAGASEAREDPSWGFATAIDSAPDATPDSFFRAPCAAPTHAAHSPSADGRRSGGAVVPPPAPRPESRRDQLRHFGDVIVAAESQ